MLLSRVADALYWISRYLERAEHTARRDRRPPRSRPRSHGRTPTAGISIGCTPALRLTPPDDAPRQSGGARRRARSSIWPTRESVLACVTAARENARQVREEISSDMWEQLNALFLRLKQAQRRRRLVGAAALRLRAWSSRACTCFMGITDATMGHGEGLAVPAGRPLPRARRVRRRRCSISTSATARCRPASGRPQDHARMGRRCCARARRSKPTAAATPPTCGRERIAEFLLLNPEFPRSVRFAAARVEASLRAIAQLTGRRRRRPRRAARRPAARVARLRPGRRDPERRSARLPRGIVRYCAQIHAALYQSYITYPIESALPA